MAAPHVAGAAALLLALHPDWTVAQVKDTLLESARPLPGFATRTVSGGTLDVGAAVRADGCTIIGTAGDDLLTGTPADDVICAGGGNDTIAPLGGDDTVEGGSGLDTVAYASAGAPVVVDLAAGIASGDGTDSLTSIESAVGGSFDDELRGDGQPNRLDGGAGSDTLSGAGGDDILAGGPGSDTASFADATGPLTVDLATGVASGEGTDALTSIESVVGGSGDDVLRGGPLSDHLDGGPGADVVDGFAGDDVVAGGPGDDALSGGPGVDTVSFAASNGSVTVDLAGGAATGEGSDLLSTFESILGSRYADTLLGNDQPNVVTALGGDDFIDGRGGNDLLDAGDGNDTVLGGTGHDVVRGGAGDDLLSGLAGDDQFDGMAGLDLCVQGTGSAAIVACESTLLPLSIGGVTVVEPDHGNVTAAFVATVPVPTDQAVKFSARTVGGTATTGSDFKPLRRHTVTIPAFATVRSIHVKVVGDRRSEPNETFELWLGNPVRATIASPSAVAIIEDNDAALR